MMFPDKSDPCIADYLTIAGDDATDSGVTGDPETQTESDGGGDGANPASTGQSQLLYSLISSGQQWAIGP